MIGAPLQMGRFRKPTAACAIAVLQIVSGGLAVAEEPPCRRDPRIVVQCFTVRGRLSIHANMRPYLWPVGTKRLLGIANPQSSAVMPLELEGIFKRRIEDQAIGDFEVCPHRPATGPPHTPLPTGVTIGTRPCSAARIIPSSEASIRSANCANAAFALRQKARRAMIPSIVFAELSAGGEMAPSSPT